MCSVQHAIHTYTTHIHGVISDDMWCDVGKLSFVYWYYVCMNNAKHWALNFITLAADLDKICIFCIFNIRSFVTKAKAIFGFFFCRFCCLFVCLLISFVHSFLHEIFYWHAHTNTRRPSLSTVLYSFFSFKWKLFV